MLLRPRTVIPGPGRNPTYRFRIIGAPAPGMRDLYHGLLRIPVSALIGLIVAGYLALNALFAALYLLTGGLANAAPGSFVDAFFFSVQTMGTIGYGAMYPASRAANALVVTESVTGLIVTAVATGLVFVRFSQTQGRVVFSHRCAISPIDGVPSLSLRVGNERGNQIFDARFRLILTRTARTLEGVTYYRSEDLPLVRERAHALTRSWNILHRIVPGTALHGETPESLAAADAELIVTLSGTDDTSLQPVHARHTYPQSDLIWGARLADVISETPDGDILLDLRYFHELAPTAPTPEFPYPASAGATPMESVADNLSR
jgi:inward rectifier potassium channel